MRKVILESPYANPDERELIRNLQYARAAVRHSVVICREAPIASHLLFTQDGILDDTIPEERKIGMLAGLAWGPVADLTVVYVDRGISPGMKAGITRACKEGRPVEFRSLDDAADSDKVQAHYERELKIGTQHLQRTLERSLRLPPPPPAPDVPMPHDESFARINDLIARYGGDATVADVLRLEAARAEEVTS